MAGSKILSRKWQKLNGKVQKRRRKPSSRYVYILYCAYVLCDKRIKFYDINHLHFMRTSLIFVCTSSAIGCGNCTPLRAVYPMPWAFELNMPHASYDRHTMHYILRQPRTKTWSNNTKERIQEDYILWSIRHCFDMHRKSKPFSLCEMYQIYGNRKSVTVRHDIHRDSNDERCESCNNMMKENHNNTGQHTKCYKNGILWIIYAPPFMRPCVRWQQHTQPNHNHTMKLPFDLHQYEKESTLEIA